MISSLFHNILYVPIYNLLIYLVDIVPNGDVGIAVIIATIIVQLVLWPISVNATKTQRRMKFVEPQLKEIKEKYKDDREKQATETFALYKNNGIKPFSSIFSMFLKLPVIIALYWVFRHEHLLSPNTSLIYHFIAYPTHISPYFLGIFATTGHVIVLAVIAAGMQYVLASLTIPVPDKSKETKPGSAEEFARILSVQSRFILPILIGVIAYTQGALALYFITSSSIGVLQEYYVRHQLRYLKIPKEA